MFNTAGGFNAASVEVINPTAVITGDLSVNEGERAYLSAGTSIAGTYPITTYLWESLDGYVINNPGSSSADLDPSASVGGTTVVRLTVTDSQGNTGTTTATITVEAVPDRPNFRRVGFVGHMKRTGFYGVIK